MDLKLELKLESNECVHGESVRFTATVRNEGREAAEGIQSLEPRNRSLRLLVSGQWEGWALGAELRERTAPNLVHWHAQTMSLEPGKSASAVGDIVWWVGVLPVGDHRIRAEYSPGEAAQSGPVLSAEVTLKVTAARCTFARAPRLPEMGRLAPMTFVWRHAADKGAKFFVHQGSRVLPPNPYSGFEVAPLEPTAEPVVSATPAPWPLVAHLLWVDKGMLQVAAAALGDRAPAAPISVKLPVSKPVILESPATVMEDHLVALVTDEDRAKLCFLRIGEKKRADIVELKLGGHAPIGETCVYWTYDQEIVLAWAAAGGREIVLGRAPWDDAASFAPRSFAAVDGELLRIDALMLPPGDNGPKEAPYFVRGVPKEPTGPEPGDDEIGPEPVEEEPRLALYTLTAERTQRRVTVSGHYGRGSSRALAKIAVPESVKGALKCVSSVMTRRRHPVYVLKDEDDALWFASTLLRELTPLDAVAGDKVTLAQFPALVAASERSETPWVHLRYWSSADGGFKFARLEPADQPDAYSMIRPRVAAVRWY